MLKFFRKHNKKLLALFMGLLMVVFVGGSALQTLMTPSVDGLIAQSALGKITFQQRAHAASITWILERMGIPWQRVLGGSADPITEIDWVLLTREARKYGIHTDAIAARAWGQRLFGIDQTTLNNFARSLRMKPAVIVAALGELASIQVVSEAVKDAAAPSVTEIRSVARQVLDKVLINAVMLPANAFYDKEADFSEEQLQTQWEKYRDHEPGPGLNFGYYVAPTVEVQYVKINRNSIAKTVGVANLAKKAKRYYERNREKDALFRRPPEAQAETGPGAMGELEGPVQPPYFSWEEAEEIAVKVIRERQATNVSERIATWIIEQASDGWMAVERGEDGYRQATPQLTGLDLYRELIERLPPSLAYPDGLTVSTTDFFFADRAASVSEIGTAAFRPPGTLPLNFARLAFQTKGVVPRVPTEEGTNRDEYLATFQSCPYPLSDFDGNYYVFRVVATVPGHAAESLDEVRDRVIADLRTLQGYETALARAEGLRHCTPGISLQEAFESDAELLEIKDTPAGEGCGFFEPSLVSRLSLADAIGGRAGKPDRTVFVPPALGVVPAEVVERWFELELTEDKTAVIGLRDRATVMVAEWVETQPGTQDDFDREKDRLASQISFRRAQEALDDWLDPEAIRARNAFELVR